MKHSLLFVGALMIARPTFAAESVDAPVGDGPAVEVTDVKSNNEILPTKTKRTRADRTIRDDGDGSSQSGDTYNFYFQKGSGPGSVEQGSGLQKVQPATAPAATPPETRATPASPAPAPTLAMANPAVEDDQSYSNFEAQAGIVTMPMSSGSGYTIGGQFNISRNWGMQVHLISIKSSELNTGLLDSDTTTTNLSGGSLAFTYTPWTVGQGGKLPVRVSALFGAMLLDARTEGTTVWGDDQTTDQSKFMALVGLSATASVTKHFGVVGYAKVPTDTKYSQVGLGVAWLL